ncbi:MAG: DUF1080 domain-containing protein [Verrucomicrobia bacterium]|nr:DUF1080 domain-containing protein [Verrucomicrobiota bacterium]
MKSTALLASLLLFSARALAAESDGFVPLFNGRDLAGWTNINCAPETWSVREGMIHCTGQPVGALRTLRQYENFILECEWRHLESAGNSGVFIWGSPISAPGVPFLRGIEVQVLDHGYVTNYERKTGKKAEWFTTHGDVFPIHGATMKPIGRHNGSRSFPSGEFSKGTPEWNHYRIVCNSGSLRLHVNGHEVSGGDECNYRKGYLALESEGAAVEFRNLRIKELPSTGAGADVTAPLDQNWRVLTTGIDARGWRTNAATAARWQIGGKIILKEAEAGTTDLWTGEEFGDGEFVVDVRPAKPAKGSVPIVPVVLLRGRDGRGSEVRLEGAEPGKFTRFTIRSSRNVVSARRGEDPAEFVRVVVKPPSPHLLVQGALGLKDTGGAVEFMNLNWRDL